MNGTRVERNSKSADKLLAISSDRECGDVAHSGSPGVSTSKMMRDLRIDALRGLVLVVMTLSHLPPSPFQEAVVQPLGIVNAAEVFVFLSGLVTAWWLGRIMFEHGTRVMALRATKRARQLYVIQVMMVTVALFGASRHVLASISAGTSTLGFWLGASLLYYQPHFLDILPMYVAFLCITPLVLSQLAKGRRTLVALLSMATWILSWTVSRYVTSAFNILAWQLVFVGGLITGFWRLENGVTRLPRWITAAAIVVATAFLFIRHPDVLGVSTVIGHPFSYEIEHRHLLTPVRILNFAALAVVVASMPRWIDAVVPKSLYRGFAFLGQHSLQVFCWSIAETYIAYSPLLKWGALHSAIQYALAIAACGMLFIPAVLHVRYRRSIQNPATVRRLAQLASE